MSMKTTAELRSENYCAEHGLYYNRFCPDCRLEEWAMWNKPKDTDNVNWVPLNEV